MSPRLVETHNGKKFSTVENCLRMRYNNENVIIIRKET